MRLRLNIVDTPGYGDQVDNDNWLVWSQFTCFVPHDLVTHPWPFKFHVSVPCRATTLDSWDPIIKYIKDQHSAYLRKELTAMRDRHIQDTRIHCALFFINPSGHSLRAIDIVVLKKLSEVVNVVPIIAKSDSLTLEERFTFKQKVRIPVASTCPARSEYECRPGRACIDRDLPCRFAPNLFTTTSACTPSTPRRPTMRKFRSTPRSG